MNRIVVSVTTALVLATGTAESAVVYKMTNLGLWTLSPTVTSTILVPLSFTADDQLLGFAPTATGLQLRRYNPADGSLTELTTATGATFSSSAFGITVFPTGNRANTVGQTVGGIPGNANIVVRNPDGSLIDHGPYVDANGNGGVAWGMNDSGKIFGNVFTGTLDTNTAFAGDVTTGLFKSIGSFYRMTNAYDMNARGQIVGRSGLPLRSGTAILWHAYVTTDTGLQDLHLPGMPPLQGLVNGSTANAINDDGLAVGEYPYRYSAGLAQMHAVVWNTDQATYTDLGKPDSRSTLRDIHNNGDAVGAEWDAGDPVGATPSANGVLVNVNGGLGGQAMTDLNTRVHGLPAGFYINRGDMLSPGGSIVAVAKAASGTQFKVLLTPTLLPADLPSAPGTLTAAPLSGTQIKLSWIDNASNETAQILERCAGFQCSGTVEIPLAANVTSYTDTGLAPGVSYKYRLRARGTTGDSLFSNSARIATLAPPATPSNIAIVSVARSKIVISWQDNSDNETGFQVERCRGSGCVNFSLVAQLPANTQTFSNTGLSSRTSYSYRVRSYNVNGASAPTGSVSATTPP